MKQAKKHKPDTAPKAYARNAGDLFLMADRISKADWAKDCLEATWGDAGDLAHARELMVRASVALGALSEAEAFEMGVTL